MQMRAINPNDWLGAFHINHAIEVTAGQRVVYCSGQTSNGPDGALLNEGDIVGQFQQAWNNLVEVLAAGRGIAAAPMGEVVVGIEKAGVHRRRVHRLHEALRQLGLGGRAAGARDDLSRDVAPVKDDERRGHTYATRFRNSLSRRPKPVSRTSSGRRRNRAADSAPAVSAGVGLWASQTTRR